MGTRGDPEITDDVLDEEIELLADLMDAAREASRPLSVEAIDAALGVRVDDPPVQGVHPRPRRRLRV
jgi:hypothetical protein